MKSQSIFLTIMFSLQIHAAPFRNLDFEEANPGILQPGINPGELFGSTTDLLPGWQVFRGDTQLTSIGYNLQSPSFVVEGGVTLISATNSFAKPIEGSFSLSINVPSEFINTDPFFMTQRGDIPDFARVLTFTYTGKPFIASINGIDVARPRQEAFTPSTQFWDISMFAGQSVELKIRPGEDIFGGLIGTRTIDSVAFLVPEPSTYAVIFVGAIVLTLPWLRRRFSDRSG